MTRDSIDYWGNDLPKCPHCGTDFKVWSNDYPLSLNYEDDGKTTFECHTCGDEFVTVTRVKYTFSTAVSEDAADDGKWGPAY